MVPKLAYVSCLLCTYVPLFKFSNALSFLAPCLKGENTNTAFCDRVVSHILLCALKHPVDQGNSNNVQNQATCIWNHYSKVYDTSFENYVSSLELMCQQNCPIHSGIQMELAALKNYVWNLEIPVLKICILVVQRFQHWLINTFPNWLEQSPGAWNIVTSRGWK